MMDGFRLSALALHAVADHDRAWLLERLPDVQRTQLSALLEELRETGIPADPELVRQLVREQEVLARSPGWDAPSARLARASAQDIWELLRAESDAVIGRIVRRHDWPWKSALLELCGPTRVKRIERLASQLAPAGGLEQALIIELDQRLNRHEPTSTRGRPPRWKFMRRTGRSN